MGSKLSYASIPYEVKKIANDSLGIGVLRSLFSYAHTYHLMIKISDGEFIGFSLYHFQTVELQDGSSYVTGVIDCICVAEPYRQEGFGTLLTFGTLRKMAAYGADRIELLFKTPGVDDSEGRPGVPLIGSEELLRCLGFRKVKVYDDYYLHNSLKFAYDCKFCGNNPDSCKAVLYSITGKDEANESASPLGA